MTVQQIKLLEEIEEISSDSSAKVHQFPTEYKKKQLSPRVSVIEVQKHAEFWPTSDVVALDEDSAKCSEYTLVTYFFEHIKQISRKSAVPLLIGHALPVYVPTINLPLRSGDPAEQWPT